MILDEAVSSLDTENERYIQKALKVQSKNRTTLVVAHRLSTIMAADKLVVINNGQVMQVGTHDTLIKEEGFYKKIVAAQFDKPAFLNKFIYLRAAYSGVVRHLLNIKMRRL